MTHFTRRDALLSAAALAAGAALPVSAQNAWPTKPISLVVPFPPGGSVDISARLINAPLAKILGQPVVIDNRGGAGGSVGTSYVAKAPRDGYTLIVASQSTHVANPVMQPNLGYDAIKDFAFVTILNRVPNVLVVHPSLPAKNFAEFIQYVRANPGKLNYASPGNGSLAHLSMELFKSTQGLFITHIPYRGGGPALTDLLGGQVQMMWDNLSPQLANVQAGKLRALAIASPARSPQLPDVPTFGELKLPDLNLTSWTGLAAPAGTPRPIIDQLYAAVRSIVTVPANEELWRAKGLMVPEAVSPEQYTKEVKDRIKLFGDLVKVNKLSIDG